MDISKAADIVDNAMGKAGCPLSEDRRIVLAGVLGVLLTHQAPRPRLADAPTPRRDNGGPWPFPKTVK